MDSPQTSTNFIQSTEAASRYGFTNDHIASLCRRGKVAGSLVNGRLWLVDEESFKAYMQAAQIEKENRKRQLSEQFKQEHQVRIDVQIKSALPPPRESLLPKFFAPTFRPAFGGALALVVVCGASYALASTLPQSQGAVQKKVALQTIQASTVTLALPALPGLPKNITFPIIAPAHTTYQAAASATAPDLVGNAFAAAAAQLGFLQYFPDAMVDTAQKGALALGALYWNTTDLLAASLSTPAPTAVVKVAYKAPVQKIAVAATASPTKVPVQKSQVAAAPVVQKVLPATTASLAGYVTQASLDKQLQQVTNSLRSLIYSSASSSATAVVPQYIAASGNSENPYAGTNRISSLTNVTVNGVAGLTTGDIPALNYFPSTSTVSVVYGGTGTSIAPSYGQLLLGNASGTYDMVATSSLGLAGSFSYATNSTAIYSSYPIIAWGDSLTAGNEDGTGVTYPNKLSTDLGGRTVANKGVGGQTSIQIGVRQGGISTTATISGGQIPASGGVTVTFPSGYEPVTSQGPSGGVSGTISGVAGAVTYSGGVYTFTRTTAGSVVNVASATLVVDTGTLNNGTVIIWAGRNDLSSPSQVEASIASMVSHLGSNTHYLILSDVNGTGEGSGTGNYTSIITANNYLASHYPGHYLDIRAYLIASGLSDAGIATSTQDTTDVSSDIVPTSLRFDAVHLNAAGYQVIAQQIANYITANIDPSTGPVLIPSVLSTVFASPYPIGAVAPSTGVFTTVGVATSAPLDTLNVAGNIGLSNSTSRSIYVRGGDAATQLNFDFPELASNTGTVRFFRSTNTSALSNSATALQIYKADGSGAVQTSLGSFSNSYLNALTGNVGIGTTSPLDKLAINGTIGVTAANGQFDIRNGNSATTFSFDFPELSTASPAVRLFRSTNTSATGLFQIFKPDGTGTNIQSQFSTGGVTFINASTGNVAIGTTTASDLLDVNGNIGLSNSTSRSLLLRGGNSASVFNIDFPELTSAAGTIRIFRSTNTTGLNNSAMALQIYKADGSGAVQTSLGSFGNSYINALAGNVGIGTTTPVAPLDVYSNGGDTLIGSQGVGFPAIAFGGGAVSGSTYTLSGSNTGTNTYLNVPLSTGTIHLRAGNGGNDLMTLLGVNGNVGIGSTTPWAQLSVNPNGISGPAFVVGSSTATQFIVDNAGHVGIGTAAPVFALDVTGISFFRSLLDVSASGISANAGSSLKLYANNAANLGLVVQTGTGNVGVGTTSPYALFSVGGASSGFSTAATLFAVASSTGNATSTYLSLDQNGFLAIGAGAGTTTTTVSPGSSISMSNSGIFTVDASSSTTTISNLSIGNLVFDADAGVVNLADIPIDTNAAAGVVQEQILALAGSTTLAVYGESDGAGGVQNQRVGVATSSPWRNFSVQGTVGFQGLTGATGAGSLCLTSNNEVVYNSASDSCLPSLRSLKHDIQMLTVSGTTTLMQLQPVSFIYNGDTSSTTRYGFIAEDTALVDQHFGTYDARGNISGVDDRSLIAVVVQALKELIATIQGFAAQFTTRKLCVADDSGAQTCITKTQLDQLLANAGSTAASGSSSGSSSDSGGSGDVATSTPDTEAPAIAIVGANPATVGVGATYVDLGAAVSDNVNANLGYRVSVDGGATTTPNALTIDTSAAGTHTITYGATDEAGNTAIATRVVNVVDLNSITFATSTATTTP